MSALTSAAALSGCAAFQSGRPARVSSSRRASVLVRADSALIVNTKGGGHAFLGLHLAKKLLADGHSVTILNDGDQAKLSAKAPFSQYASLGGAQVVWGNPTDASSIPAGPFDVVYDNNGKDMDNCKPLIDHFKGKVKHYVYVSSGGAYTANEVEPMHVEGDKRKSSAGHVAVEQYLEEADMPFTVFQPQYIYGPHTAKDCEQWFMERILRDRPVPIPGPGIQLTSLSHVDDLADMMARVPGNAAATREHFNLVSDRCITLDGIAKAVGAAAGKDVKIVHYDPAQMGLKKGEGFPFRTGHFFSSADKAKRVLGWQPKHNFLKDVEQLVADFKASGRLDKTPDFTPAASAAPSIRGTTLAVSASGAAAGAPLGNASVASLLSSGLITRQEASVYSSDQLAFLARKRSPSQRGAAARAAAASMPGAAGAGAAEVQAWLSRGVISKQAAATFSPEQLAFLARKRGGA
ncbi:Chloroplast stem-loop binding of 41 kDa chloroplastic [Micractinium conductrix]|uniref:Chloroplast stem-loop binding of 41 kDa chloroplastic n=1 Tax=Micractinium conductrix TaxID=554055 RepID=A0A2P6VD64_9CHLO|nr:Chloroplast stem-loop binding of 41 kDa chloroplastic [Micractinium conductrix]|eukprot:PSC72036.1 Chloroplast stem-loop binding of 41 kDa chloroplastic [Micractinium conductrix]